MSFNNAYIISALDAEDDKPILSPKPRGRRSLKSSVCLIERLPSTAFIQREADRLAPRSVIRQLKHHLSDSEEDSQEDVTEGASESEEQESPTTPTSPAPPSPSTVKANLLATVSKVFKPALGKPRSGAGAGGEWKEPQPWEVMQAVERKDVMFLMELRDRAFHLLLRRTGDATPLLHAMRIGTSHRDVAILLVGAMSRYVNHLEDEDMDKPRTKTLLKALRANLKLAIDNSLAVPDQSDLIASFLQTLVMSEGDRWLVNTIQNVALELRAEGGRPVQVAEEAVRKFATRELGKAKGLIASVDDYIANATGDLVMMAAWGLALEQISGGEAVPIHAFARDDRVFKLFSSRLVKHRSAVRAKLGRRLRWELKVLDKIFEGRQETRRKQVELLQEEFDGAEDMGRVIVGEE